MAEKTSKKELYDLFKDLNIKPKQIKFICYYCNNGFNASQAYIDAGYSDSTPNSVGASASALLKVSKIVEGMRRYIAMILAPHKTELEKRLFDTWFHQAFYDVSMFYTPAGEIAFDDWEQIPPEWRCCVESMEVKYFGKDASRSTVVLKLVDKKWAQAQLDKYIGMTRERVEVQFTEIPNERKKEIGKMFEGKLE